MKMIILVRNKVRINIRVAKIDAEIYHYGWVRPPDLMQDLNNGKQIGGFENYILKGPLN